MNRKTVINMLLGELASPFFLALALSGYESARSTLVALENGHQRGTATGQVDFYGVKASVFTGQKFEPLDKRQRHRLEPVGLGLYAMTEVYTASTSAERAKSISKLGMAMHARQLGFDYISYEQNMLRVICNYKFGVVENRSHPITFTRARYAITSKPGFIRVNDVLTQSAQFETDAPRQEKIDAQLHWVDRCTIINTRDPSDMAPADYDFSLSTKPPPNFHF